MNIFSYWECIPGREMPPYVLLGLSSVKRVFGERFQLLTPKAVHELGIEVQKEWKFLRKNESEHAARRSIVAKSDYLRLAVVAQEGGFWLDADTIVLRDFTEDLMDLNPNNLWWDSEAFFGSNPGNSILKESAQDMWAAEFQQWGNPGGIKDKKNAPGADVSTIPTALWNPGAEPPYNFKNWSVMLEDLGTEQFLLSKKTAILKLYNSTLQATEYADMSVREFLATPTLLARIFLSMNADVDDWVAWTDELWSEIVNGS